MKKTYFCLTSKTPVGQDHVESCDRFQEFMSIFKSLVLVSIQAVVKDFPKFEERSCRPYHVRTFCYLLLCVCWRSTLGSSRTQLLDSSIWQCLHNISVPSPVDGELNFWIEKRAAWSMTYCGWLRNPAPVNRWFIPVVIAYRVSTIQGDAGFLPSTVVWPKKYLIG